MNETKKSTKKDAETAQVTDYQQVNTKIEQVLRDCINDARRDSKHVSPRSFRNHVSKNFGVLYSIFHIEQLIARIEFEIDPTFEMTSIDFHEFIKSGYGQRQFDHFGMKHLFQLKCDQLKFKVDNLMFYIQNGLDPDMNYGLEFKIFTSYKLEKDISIFKSFGHGTAMSNFDFRRVSITEIIDGLVNVSLDKSRSFRNNTSSRKEIARRGWLVTNESI